MDSYGTSTAAEARRRIKLPWEVEKFADSWCCFISGDGLIRVTVAMTAGSRRHLEYTTETRHGRKGWQPKDTYNESDIAELTGYMATRLKGLCAQWPQVRISEWGHLLRGRHNGYCLDDCPHGGSWDRVPELDEDELQAAWQAMIDDLS